MVCYLLPFAKVGHYCLYQAFQLYCSRMEYPMISYDILRYPSTLIFSTRPHKNVVWWLSCFNHACAWSRHAHLSRVLCPHSILFCSFLPKNTCIRCPSFTGCQRISPSLESYPYYLVSHLRPFNYYLRIDQLCGQNWVYTEGSLWLFWLTIDNGLKLRQS